MVECSPCWVVKMTRWWPTLNRLYALPVSAVTCLASDAGLSAYCSILEMIRTRSRALRRRISLMARLPHSICSS